MLLANVFDATLWGFQRFDVLNAIDIPVTALRVALTFAVVGRGGDDLLRLALVTVATTLLGGAAKAVMSFRTDPGLRVALSGVSRAAARPLFGYGSSYFVLAVARMAGPQFSPLVVGARLGVGLVTPYSIGVRLVGYAGQAVAAGAGVLTPVATALHAERRDEQQRRLLLAGGRHCLALSLFFALPFLITGGPLVRLWMGREMDVAARALGILALGELVPMSQLISSGVILGMGGHRRLAWLGVIEAALGMGLAVALAVPYGLDGICVALGAAGTLFRGLAQLEYACRLTRVPLTEYLVRSVLPALGSALLPAAALGTTAALLRPRGWLQFGACVTAYLAAWAVSYALTAGREVLRFVRPGEPADGPPVGEAA
jgi:O-antigen/teichoic acid export membrane protein